MKQLQKKICLLGDFSVGKTSLTRRFVEGKFSDTYLSTVGVKISRRLIELPDSSVSMVIWDLAGGDDFLAMRTNYLRGVAGALFVCDLTRPETLETCHQYKEQLSTINGHEVPSILLANKVDLVAERAITDEMLKASCLTTYHPHYLTSAKTGEQVEVAFASLAEQLVPA